MSLKKRLIILAAYISPTISCILGGFIIAVPPLSVVPIMSALFLGGNFFSLIQGWESLGAPNQAIVSFAADADHAYVSTADKKIWARYFGSSYSPKEWLEVNGQFEPDFEQPPLLAFCCYRYLYAADGANLYMMEVSYWKKLDSPIQGPIREIVILSGDALMILVVGKDQIALANQGPQWKQIWNGASIDSNLGTNENSLLLASNGKIWRLSFSSYMGRFPSDDYSGWSDVTGNLTDKSIKFVALGEKDWAVAASENRVYRTRGEDGNWELFMDGLPNNVRVRGIAGERTIATDRRLFSEIALFTDRGLFVFNGNGSWNYWWQYQKPIAFLHLHQVYIEGSSQTMYIASKDGVWRRKLNIDGVGAFAIGSLLLGPISILLLLFTVLPGVILGRKTKKWLARHQGVS